MIDDFSMLLCDTLFTPYVRAYLNCLLWALLPTPFPWSHCLVRGPSWREILSKWTICGQIQYAVSVPHDLDWFLAQTLLPPHVGTPCIDLYRQCVSDFSETGKGVCTSTALTDFVVKVCLLMITKCKFHPSHRDWYWSYRKNLNSFHRDQRKWFLWHWPGHHNNPTSVIFAFVFCRWSIVYCYLLFGTVFFYFK